MFLRFYFVTSYMREVVLERGSIFRFTFIVFENNNRVKINKTITLPCHIFILLLFSDKKIFVYVKNIFWKEDLNRTNLRLLYSTFHPFSTFTPCNFFILVSDSSDNIFPAFCSNKMQFLVN